MFEFSTRDTGVALEPLELGSGDRLFRVVEWSTSPSYGGNRNVHVQSAKEFRSLLEAYDFFVEMITKRLIVEKHPCCELDGLVDIGRKYAKMSEASIRKLLADATEME